ncbi:beta-ketoacyl-ACP reductase [Pontibacter sp. FD36]|uniref:beta-ketoacyl synthase N-terminal-like domain-containing protein n=1 Tax=Pontibacter sp. FD36 TaxID=2789860 RepID=UPI0018A94D24|nr:beta-ketoacyl synthase N-terminal-like domain-containing protein [Pontibacter sp. FD36]MBF8962790.1 beta-ketoacyl-ACP reductase [Pontibacter sp. FD36]
MERAKEHVVIRGYGAISPLGYDVWSTSQSYVNGKPVFTYVQHGGRPTPVATLSAGAESQLQQLVSQNPNYHQLDRSVLLAIFAARQAVIQAGWTYNQSEAREDLAVNVGSSRGATGLTEQHFEAYQQGTLSATASPTTTLGNLSSWVAHAVQAGGAQISHSITCSTALMAIANGVAWLRAGMAQRFLAGGTEAPLTNFTIAQMKAIGIYSTLWDQPFPCQPYGTSGQNTFMLGEGAAVLALEKVPSAQLEKGSVIIEALGFGFEQIKSKTGISAEGLNFQQAMRQAISQLPLHDQSVDVIITHSPGTRAGDKAELSAIQALFQDNIPSITTNKHLLGHTLGSSGALSVQYALHLFEQQSIVYPGYSSILQKRPPHTINRILVNAAGFGGNAASLVLSMI